ncbi:hypothetical protein I4F81_001905 [Pyropia yezoensis]|uniref:Uncharacterized protein n=1 Tax=Pyropia yezoensis TaxID=2788 RepID=A0ACC3BNY9_PYRYE|nr:hypothetical protein I4F81_001905 [Neopyropia yezoensis]
MAGGFHVPRGPRSRGGARAAAREDACRPHHSRARQSRGRNSSRGSGSSSSGSGSSGTSTSGSGSRSGSSCSSGRSSGSGTSSANRSGRRRRQRHSASGLQQMHCGCHPSREKRVSVGITGARPPHLTLPSPPATTIQAVATAGEPWQRERERQMERWARHPSQPCAHPHAWRRRCSCRCRRRYGGRLVCSTSLTHRPWQLRQGSR